jgi:hypothetical protein
MTGRRLSEETTDALARDLYEIMERLETVEPPGERWDKLPEVYKPWYRECVVELLSTAPALEAAKALSASR